MNGISNRADREQFHWRDGARIPLPRAGCAAGVVAGQLVLAGGTYWRDDQKQWCDRVDAYDVARNQWAALASLPRASGDVASAVVDDRLYVFGGGAAGETESVTWVLDREQWHEAPDMRLPAPRRYGMAMSLDGTIFLLGGIEGAATDFASAQRTFWSVKPGERWESRAPMPSPVRFGCTVGGVGSRIVVAGGCTPENGAVRNLDEILSYDPEEDKWSLIGRLRIPLRGAAAWVERGRLYGFGGYTDKFETAIFAINPGGSVAQIGDLPIGLAGARFVAIQQTIVGVSGEDGIKKRYAGTLLSNAIEA